MSVHLLNLRRDTFPGQTTFPYLTMMSEKISEPFINKLGREAAILDGLGFAGSKLQYYVKQARKIAPNRKLLLYCWRGGMRSESMAWLLSLSGFDANLMKGGYKAYRNCIRNDWNKKA
jgi:tRNA 2-selenouridine synthase